MMDYIILTSRHSDQLAEKVRTKIAEGYKLHGSLNVIRTHEQLRFSGMQHKDTTYENEYSQAMIKEDDEKEYVELKEYIKLWLMYRNGEPNNFAIPDENGWWDNDYYSGYDVIYIEKRAWEDRLVNIDNFGNYIIK